jgi:hypothetical protein
VKTIKRICKLPISRNIKTLLKLFWVTAKTEFLRKKAASGQMKMEISKPIKRTHTYPLSEEFEEVDPIDTGLQFFKAFLRIDQLQNINNAAEEIPQINDTKIIFIFSFISVEHFMGS